MSAPASRRHAYHAICVTEYARLRRMPARSRARTMLPPSAPRACALMSPCSHALPRAHDYSACARAPSPWACLYGLCRVQQVRLLSKYTMMLYRHAARRCFASGYEASPQHAMPLSLPSEHAMPSASARPPWLLSGEKVAAIILFSAITPLLLMPRHATPCRYAADYLFSDVISSSPIFMPSPDTL